MFYTFERGFQLVPPSISGILELFIVLSAMAIFLVAPAL